MPACPSFSNCHPALAKKKLEQRWGQHLQYPRASLPASQLSQASKDLRRFLQLIDVEK